MKDLKLSLIVAAIDRATAPLRRIGQGLDGLHTRISKLSAAMKGLRVAEFFGGAAIIGGVTLASRSIWEMTNRVADLGESFVLAAKKAGVFDRVGGVENFERLQFAVTQLGGDADGLSTVFFQFQNHLADALKGVKESRRAMGMLGISMKDAKRLSADPIEAFLRLSDGFHGISNPALRAKLALDLFSRSGVQMLPVLMAGRGEISKFMAQLDAAHDVMSKKDAEAGEAFIQHKRQMGLALQGLQLQIGVRLLPVMTLAIDKITAWIERLQPAAIDRFTSAIDGLVNKLPEILPELERAGELAFRLAGRLLKLTGITTALKGVMIALAAVMAAQIIVVFAQAALAIGGAAAAIGTFVGFVGSMVELAAGVSTFADAMALLDIALDANPIGLFIVAVVALVTAIAAIGTVVYQVIKHWDFFRAWFHSLWMEFGPRIKAALAAAFPAIMGLAWLVDEIKKHWSGITAFFAGLFDRLAGVFTAGWKRLESLTPDWLKTLLKIGAVGMTLAVAPGAAPAVAGALLPHQRPTSATNPHPAAAPKPAEDSHHKIDLALAITSGGQVLVQGAKTSGPNTSLTVTGAPRGRMPAG